MKKFGIFGLVVIAAVAIGLWHSANAVDPHYIGDTVAANRGNLVIDSALEIARGKVAGVTSVSVVGRNIDVDAAAIADIWDGGETGGASLIWLAPTAVRVHTVVSTSATDVTSSLELTLTGQPADTQTVTIGTKPYTFRATLGILDGSVHIDHTNQEGTINNLVAAVNLAAGGGTAYATAMTANSANVIAVKTAADDFTIYTVAATPIAVAETMDNATWAGAGIITIAGTGAQTLRIYGLTSWDTAEVSEDINLRGLSAVTLTNSYVIINKMVVLTNGGTKVNTGIISATAATDATVSARIRVNQGQTQMAIFGIPSTQTAYCTRLHMSMNRAATNASLSDIQFFVNTSPHLQTTQFLAMCPIGLQSVGTTAYEEIKKSYNVIPGPAIIKAQGSSTAADADISAGFDLFLVDN